MVEASARCSEKAGAGSKQKQTPRAQTALGVTTSWHFWTNSQAQSDCKRGQLLAGRVRADHANPKNTRNVISCRSLESYGNFLLARDQLGRNCVLDVKEAHFLFGTASLGCLLSHFLAIHQDVE